jgi:hypothetical protein
MELSLLFKGVIIMDRIMKAFTFKTEVYAEVESDTSFTTTAWIIVAVVSFLNQIGARSTTNFSNWLLWQIVGFIGIVGAFSLALACIVTPLIFIGWILMVIAWFLAVKEALDLEWVPTIITVILGWIALFIVSLIATGIIALFYQFLHPRKRNSPPHRGFWIICSIPQHSVYSI